MRRRSDESVSVARPNIGCRGLLTDVHPYIGESIDVMLLGDASIAPACWLYVSDGDCMPTVVRGVATDMDRGDANEVACTVIPTAPVAEAVHALATEDALITSTKPDCT